MKRTWQIARFRSDIFKWSFSDQYSIISWLVNYFEGYKGQHLWMNKRALHLLEWQSCTSRRHKAPQSQHFLQEQECSACMWWNVVIKSFPVQLKTKQNIALQRLKRFVLPDFSHEIHYLIRLFVTVTQIDKCIWLQEKHTVDKWYGTNVLMH